MANQLDVCGVVVQGASFRTEYRETEMDEKSAAPSSQQSVPFDPVQFMYFRMFRRIEWTNHFSLHSETVAHRIAESIASDFFKKAAQDFQNPYNETFANPLQYSYPFLFPESLQKIEEWAGPEEAPSPFKQWFEASKKGEISQGKNKSLDQGYFDPLMAVLVEKIQENLREKFKSFRENGFLILVNVEKKPDCIGSILSISVTEAEFSYHDQVGKKTCCVIL